MRHLFLSALFCVMASSCSVKKAKKPQPQKLINNDRCISNPSASGCVPQAVDPCSLNLESEACKDHQCKLDPTLEFCKPEPQNNVEKADVTIETVIDEDNVITK